MTCDTCKHRLARGNCEFYHICPGRAKSILELFSTAERDLKNALKIRK